VLDLFAGSGQMGLEALSRGAESCMFVDSSQEAMAIVKKNVQKAGFFDLSRFLVSDYRNYIRKMANERSFDLIFIDPPYADNAVGDALERIVKANLAEKGCIIVCESGNENIFEEKPELSSLFEVKKSARYSKSYVTILSYLGK
jgi:16S rRNA (guanine(966)-N(2))-methyltransferase RsmD